MSPKLRTFSGPNQGGSGVFRPTYGVGWSILSPKRSGTLDERVPSYWEATRLTTDPLRPPPGDPSLVLGSCSVGRGHRASDVVGRRYAKIMTIAARPARRYDARCEVHDDDDG